MQLAGMLAALLPSAAAELAVGSSNHCGACFLVINSNLNFIQRRVWTAADPLNNSAPLPWNRSVSPASAVEVQAGVFAVGQHRPTQTWQYYWRGVAVRPEGCPPPAGVQMVAPSLITNNSVPSFLVRPRDGAIFAVATSADQTIRCMQSNYSYRGTADAVTDFAVVAGCVWYVTSRGGQINVQSPGCGKTVDLNVDAGTPARLAWAFDELTERLLVVTGNQPTPDVNDAVAQDKTSRYGKIIEITVAGGAVTRAAGLCAPTSIVSTGDTVIVADAGTFFEQEITVVHSAEILGSAVNFGWPMVEGKQGLTVFTRPTPFGSRLVAPTMVVASVPPVGYNIEKLSLMAIIGLTGLLAVLCVIRAICWPRLTKEDTVWFAGFVLLILYQATGMIEAPGYAGTASFIGVEQSALLHPVAWLGAFASLSIGATASLVVAAIGTNQQWVASAVAGGLLGLHTVVAAGGVRRPWRLSWEGWVLGVLAMVLIGAAWAAKPAARYEEI